MKKTWIKIVIPVAILGIGLLGMGLLKASAKQDEEKKPLDLRPTVRVKPAEAIDYSVQLDSYGEIRPFESTQISAQVAGEVISWNAQFVAGGLVRRGEVLFSIEKDQYEAALLQAEANLQLAKAQLIEEQARADVAKAETKNMPKDRITDLYLRKPQVLSAKASVKSAEAALKIAQRDLDNCEIVAPYDALVVSRDLGKGQYVNKGAQVAEIYNVEVAEVTFPIAGFDSAFLPDNLNQHPASIVVKGNKRIQREALITRDLGIVDKATRMSQLVAQIKDPYGIHSNAPALKFGSYVEVSFTGKTLHNVFRLPQELVTQHKVWVVNGEQALESKVVEVAREDDTYFLVSAGLINDDRIVLTLPEYPQNGLKVKLAGQTEAQAAGKTENQATIVAKASN